MSALLVGDTNHQPEVAYDMTHRKDENAIDSVLEVLIANGMEGMADAMTTLMNAAMKIERSLLVDPEGEIIEGATSGNLCIDRPWPGIMRTLYGDHKRFFET